MPERFEIYIVYEKRYINTLPYVFVKHLYYNSGLLFIALHCTVNNAYILFVLIK